VWDGALAAKRAAVQLRADSAVAPPPAGAAALRPRRLPQTLQPAQPPAPQRWRPPPAGKRHGQTSVVEQAGQAERGR
jgi:hypothetical protein